MKICLLEAKLFHAGGRADGQEDRRDKAISSFSQLCERAVQTRDMQRAYDVTVFDVQRAVHRNVISIVKPTRFTKVSNLFHFGMTLYMFRTVFPSIIRSSRLYIQQQAYVKQILLLLASRYPF